MLKYRVTRARAIFFPVNVVPSYSMAGVTDPEKNDGQDIHKSAPQQSQQNAADQYDYSMFTVNQKNAIVAAASLISFYLPL